MPAELRAGGGESVAHGFAVGGDREVDWGLVFENRLHDEALVGIGRARPLWRAGMRRLRIHPCCRNATEGVPYSAFHGILQQLDGRDMLDKAGAEEGVVRSI